MEKTQVKNITIGFYKNLKKYAHRVSDRFDERPIHNFRVEYKRLRSFLRMISQCYGIKEEIKTLKTLKKAYTLSGYIRDLQLQQQRIIDATKQAPKRPVSYLTFLQADINRLKPELLELLLGKAINESKKDTLANIPDGFRVDSFRLYIKRKWAAIYSIILAGHFSDDNIHAIRKHLKDLFYNLDIYEGIEHNILSVTITKGKEETHFKKLLDELGSFQDKCSSIALMRLYWLNSVNPYERQLLDQLKKTWIREKLVMKQALIKKIKAEVLTQPVRLKGSLQKMPAGA